MKKYDLVVTWPANVDYPLFRLFIRENRASFEKVIIVFSPAPDGSDYRRFVRDAMTPDDCLILDSPGYLGEKGDWRHVAITHALRFSTSEWVCFIEQDFLVISSDFFDDVQDHMTKHRVFGVDQGGRLHPCCLFMTKEVLNMTSKNFGIVPDRLDHFGLIQEDLLNMNEQVGYLNTSNYYHMNGLSHNFYLATKMMEIVYRPDEFKRYLEKCVKLDIPLDDRFKSVVRSIVLQ